MPPTRKKPKAKAKPKPRPNFLPNLNPNAPPTCEFTTPCTTTTTATPPESPTTPQPKSKPKPKPIPLRKLISHVFGRNKASTKEIPAGVWVHYCRKHYQRARYRCSNWAREQCELLLVSLERLQTLGKVRDFELVLRRREGLRLKAQCAEGGSVMGGIEGGDFQDGEGGGGDAGNYDQGDDGSYNMEEEAEAEEEEEEEEEEGGGGEGEESTPQEGGRKRKKPTVQPSPVPRWLREKTGPHKSFAEMRAIIHKLIEHFVNLEKKLNEEFEERKKRMLQFPDVEILPIFYSSSSSSSPLPSSSESGSGSSSKRRTTGKGKKRVKRVKNGAVRKI